VKWEKDGLYAIRADGYVITKNSTAAGWIYLGFCNKELICRVKTANEAKAACERHKNESQ